MTTENDHIESKEQKVLKVDSKGINFDYQKWKNLGLNKVLTRALDECGFQKPTKIQELAVPTIFSGKDVLGRSVTGSGKTAAFLLPIIQKIYENKFSNYIKGLIILPTRELAFQCYEMFKILNTYTRLSCTIIIGKTSLAKQETELRKVPDLVIATPGRIVDINKNSRNIDFDDVEFLIFDEADRLLDMGFQAEIDNILEFTQNDNRQTLLFSATLDKGIEKLIRLSLKDPLRVEGSSKDIVVNTLQQEIIKVENGLDDKYKEAIVVYLVEKILVNKRVIVFLKTKRQCHRLAVVFRQLKINAEELHGDMNQLERINSYNNFKKDAGVLLATDLASRGLDFRQVEYVINFSLPKQQSSYIHRIGRTARAGKSGSAITILDDKDFLRFKKMIKEMKQKIFKRKVNEDIIKEKMQQIELLEGRIHRVFKQERREKDLEQAEREAQKAQNMLDFASEIYNRPKREWIVSTDQKRTIRKHAKKNTNKFNEHQLIFILSLSLISQHYLCNFFKLFIYFLLLSRNLVSSEQYSSSNSIIFQILFQMFLLSLYYSQQNLILSTSAFSLCFYSSDILISKRVTLI